MPWHAELEHIPQQLAVCGGAIIGGNKILTASHCFHDGRLFIGQSVEWAVRAGHEKGTFGTVFNVSRIVVHPDFSRHQPQFNDITIVLLKATIVFTDFIRPVCLPSTSTTRQFNRDDRGMMIIGGTGSKGNFSGNRQFTYTSIPLCSQRVCQAQNGVHLCFDETLWH